MRTIACLICLSLILGYASTGPCQDRGDHVRERVVGAEAEKPKQVIVPQTSSDCCCPNVTPSKIIPVLPKPS